MTRNGQATSVSSGPIAVTHVGGDVWILRLFVSLEHETVSALREAFTEALSRNATDIVVDLGSVAKVSTEGAAALTGMADLMLNRNGALWIAAAWPDKTGYTLRPIREAAPAGLTGVDPALDRALRQIPDRAPAEERSPFLQRLRVIA